MNTPEWLKPGIYGALIGAVCVGVVGFTWGGWVTGGTANERAMAMSRNEVRLRLVRRRDRPPQVRERHPRPHVQVGDLRDHVPVKRRGQPLDRHVQPDGAEPVGLDRARVEAARERGGRRRLQEVPPREHLPDFGGRAAGL